MTLRFPQAALKKAILKSLDETLTGRETRRRAALPEPPAALPFCPAAPHLRGRRRNYGKLFRSFMYVSFYMVVLFLQRDPTPSFQALVYIYLPIYTSQ